MSNKKSFSTLSSNQFSSVIIFKSFEQLCNTLRKPETDLEVARPLLTTMHKMHRAGVDNYVTTDGRLRKLTPRECLRLMGFSDSFKIVVSDTSMYQQAGNSIVVDVLIHIMEQILLSYPKLND